MGATVGILDYGLGNLRSVAKALASLGYGARVSSRPAELLPLAGLVLPGVGAFGEAMRRLEAMEAPAFLREYLEAGKPVLGICLGLQLLFARSAEGGPPGLGFLTGEIRRLPPGLPVPHVGWNEVIWEGSWELFRGLRPGTCFYFVHSYYADPQDLSEKQAAVPGAASAGIPGVACGGTPRAARVAVTEYGVPVLAALELPPLYAVQFHPEKSGRAGLRVLANFGERCRC